MSQTKVLYSLIVQIKNGLLANRRIISSPISKIGLQILDILCKEGFLLGYSLTTKKVYPEYTQNVNIYLKYYKGLPAIKTIQNISRPGCRIFISKENLWKNKDTFNFFILSTPQGLMSDKAAKIQGLGGEVLLKIS